MNKIFISYRRDDTAHLAGRLYDALAQRYTAECIYKDVDSIPGGVDYRKHLFTALRGSRIVIVLIGTRWASITDATGQRRIEHPTDVVRKEIEFSLQRKLIVIPVLTDHATMPKTEELPRSISQILSRNAMKLRPDPDFHSDLKRLFGVLDAEVQPNNASIPPPLPKFSSGPGRPTKKIRATGKRRVSTIVFVILAVFVILSLIVAGVLISR